MHKFLQICFVITFIYVAAFATAQESQSQPQSRLPVSMSFGYEHPSASNNMGESESETPIISRTPVMSSNSDQRSYQSSYEDSEVPLRGSTTNDVEMNEEGNMDSQLGSPRTRSSGSSHTNYEQLNDETIALAIKNTTGSNRMNETEESEPSTRNSTIIKRKKSQEHVEDISTPRHAPRRNNTLHRDQDHNRVKNITEIEKATEEKNQEKNITNVTFPGGRHGMKNETSENSAFMPRAGFEWLGFTAALVALLNF